ncbi:MAG: hypothetical protein AB7I38_07485 [Dehalococcoidia bacterium]
MSNPLTRAAAAAVLVLVLAATQTSLVSAQAAGEISGNLPQNGGYAIVVWGGGTPDALVQAATNKGCSPASIWITAQGQFVPYVVGAPAFVNEGFVGRFDGGSLPGGTPVIIVCQAQ